MLLKINKNRIMRGVASVYIELFRNIPTLFWLLFFYFVFPALLPERFGTVLNSYKSYNFIASLLGLMLSNGAYVAEILRGGLESVPTGQIEAAISHGLSRVDRWIHIILPQAVRIVLPPLTTRMMHNLKNTSLAMAVTVNEITWTTQQIESLTFRGVEVTTVATIFFIILNIVFGLVSLGIEKLLFGEKRRMKKNVSSEVADA